MVCLLTSSNTVDHERTLGEDGLEIIRLTIVAEDGTSTQIDIPLA